MLKRYQKDLTGQEFYDLLTKAVSYKIVSNDVLTKFSEDKEK
jgi:hypothetical protein